MFKIAKILFLLPFMGPILAACSAEMAPIVNCEPVDDIQPVCNMQTPEDIAALADGRHLLLAHYGGLHEGTGSLSLFDTETQTLEPLFPLESDKTKDGASIWGNVNCPAPQIELFRPHGTHLHTLANGDLRYLVVNHGGRESIEMFELTMAGSNSSLTWRGCVLAKEETSLNDVVGLSNGDIIFSRMSREGGTFEMLKSTIGMDTGDLWRWNEISGLHIIPGTDASQPNGLEISADERFIFANMYMEKEVWKIDAKTGKTVAIASVNNPDNSAWGTNGNLIVASHTDSMMNMFICFKLQTKPCGASFEIISVDPNTMTTERVYQHSGAPMGAATIAVPQAGRVYLGSFAGDRLISVPDFSRAK
jgi:hypothetical protein